MEQSPKINPKQARLQNDPDRAPRDVQPTAAQAGDGLISHEMREAILENQWVQTILPDPPSLPGFHLCWLSTTNQYDSVAWRVRLGYVPVKASEVPGFSEFHVHSGEHNGHVSCNEMLLYKIPDAAYQQIMRHYHHSKPQEESDRLKSNVENLKEEARDREGATLISEVGDGLDDLKPRRSPKTFE